MTREQRIRLILQNGLAPVHLEIQNESSSHSVPKGSETHFKVVVVAGAFEGRSLLDRHRLVNDLLREELKTGLHALSLHSATPAEWAGHPTTAKSPACLGGSKADKGVKGDS